MELWLVVGVVTALVLMFFRAGGAGWLFCIVAWVVVGHFADLTNFAGDLFLLVFLILPAIAIGMQPFRKAYVTPHILSRFKRIMPAMSGTERDALEAGTTWWEVDLFSGNPDWKKLLTFPRPTLTDEEQSFLDHEVNELCDMVNDWETTQVLQDLPPRAWQYIKEKGFLGMIIPKMYGGKEFSATMHSQVIMKLSTRSSALAVSVMVPNSLGPAELILHYGTDAQKIHYLPRLALGIEVPCFALTNAYAGSDAASIPDVGVVCTQEYEGKQTLGLRVTWSKRYITLAPVATLLGLAFRTLDPDKLIGTERDLGITCALVPTKHPGVNIGRRHWPLNAVFQNGPTSGDDVFIPMEWVIGGQAMVGKGWRMLMECLAAGRAISLPASNVGMSKLAVRGTSAYAAIRRQFKTPIGKFEGVQEALARMGGNLYMTDAARQLSTVALDLGEKPAVISAIVKYHVTERARTVVNDGMDILGGKGICIGPQNFLARAYQQLPIGITVEGANILTRCLIIFGQGAIRAHPYVLREMIATQEQDPLKATRDFDSAFFGHLSFTAANLVRSFVHGLTGGSLTPVPQSAAGEMHHFYHATTRLCCAFALLADFSMFTLGDALKRREHISARLGDILSQLYLISATLKRYEDDGRQVDDEAYVHWSVQDALHKAQQAMVGVLENLPNRFLAVVLRIAIFPFGRPHSNPSDALGKDVAEAMQTNGESRDRLLGGSYAQGEMADPVSCCEIALAMLGGVEAIEERLKPIIASGQLAPLPHGLDAMRGWAARATLEGFIDAQERQRLLEFTRVADLAIQVDDFTPDLGAYADGVKRNTAANRSAPLNV